MVRAEALPDRTLWRARAVAELVALRDRLMDEGSNAD
jgi:hypothetical protein